MAELDSLSARPFSPALRRNAEWVAVSIVALVWAALLRGPYLGAFAVDGDEALFLMIGKAWMAGHPPYTVIWDLKPPGLYLVYGAISALFGDSLVGPKVASLVAVAATGVALYAFGVKHLRSRLAGLVALLLYVPSTLVLDGLASKPDLMMAPFLAWGAVATLASIRAEEAWAAAFAGSAAGLLVGCAVTLKQTAVFEAAWFFLALATARRPWRWRLGPFVAGCMAAPAGFMLLFASQGLLLPFLQGSVLSALHRIGGDGVPLVEAPGRFAGMLKPVLPLVALSGLLWAERRRLASADLRGGLLFVSGWTVASATAVFLMRATYAAYFQPLLPSLSLLSAVFLVLTPWPWPTGRVRNAAALAVTIVAALYPLGYLLMSPQQRLLRTQLPETVARYLRGEILERGDSIYVVDYEPAVYLLAGATAPTRFVLPMHLLCPFPGRGVNARAEITQIMAQRPRCLVVSTSHRRMPCQDEALTRLPEQLGATTYTIARQFSDGDEAVEVLCRPKQD